MKIEKLTTKDIEEMPYTDFISLIREENRPPGGKKTIREFLLNSFVNVKSKVLEVGCTNGFTTLEVARVLGCKTYGIDINNKSLFNARNRITKEKAKFIYGDAYNIPFKDNSFDLVICSNATSFMKDKNKALSEYKRVVKPWKFIAVSPMYYLKNPPQKMVDKVSEIIGTKIDITSKEDWLKIFEQSGSEIYYSKDYKFNLKSKEEIERYVNKSLNKKHIQELPKDISDKIKLRWKDTINAFNENLIYVGYSVILLRKRLEPEEIELFYSEEEKHGK
jgi:ubiquinone/menaquinone biosynthesis C-methylase UbiE